MASALAIQIGNLLERQSVLKCVIGASLQLDPYNCPEPDLSVYVPDPAMTTVLLPDAVRLVIEVANDSLAYDLGEKAQRYAAAGIADYWVVDLVGRVTHVHGQPGPEGYATRQVVRFEEPLTHADLPASLVVAALD